MHLRSSASICGSNHLGLKSQILLWLILPTLALAEPAFEVRRAEAATLACDLSIVLGSSLVVYPAAAFPRVAKESGAKLAIINNQPTDIDPLCDLVISQDIGPTLSAVVD